MTRNEMIEWIDCSIARLQGAKTLLLEFEGSNQELGRSRISKRRPISPEGRRRIADAQKARWVRVKNAMKV